MKFRSYLQKSVSPSLPVSLVEADLLGVPSSGTSAGAGESPLSKTQWTNPSQDAQAAVGEQPPEQAEPHGSGRPPDQMDAQLKKAGAMASELLKLLTTMPRPWNRRFGVFNQALRRLLDKLNQIS